MKSHFLIEKRELLNNVKQRYEMFRANGRFTHAFKNKIGAITGFLDLYEKSLKSKKLNDLPILKKQIEETWVILVKFLREIELGVLHGKRKSN